MDLTQAIDALMEPVCKPSEPGAAVIVARNGTVVFRKGYGLANLELAVPIEPHMVFRLGSITKQFTAVAILMLVEQGALSLDDDITTFWPDYPTHGHPITVEHLLTHTSGIKSYTSMPEWLSLWRKDMTVEEIIDLFKDQPMDFAPRERWAYSNSCYHLLGAIIEKVSGQTYEEYLKQRIFDPLGMTHSCYDHAERIVPGRVAGYQKGREGYENAPYLSMTHPYAAGGLLSSVDDLVLWDEALYTDKLLAQHTLERAFRPAVLRTGASTGYGYGWEITSYEGHRMIEHSGGIPGFRTDAIRLPDDHLFVAVLMNSTAGEPPPEQLAVKIAALAIGHPYQEPVAITLDTATLDAYVGVYQVDEDEQAEQVVTRDGDHLSIQRTGGQREDIFPLSSTEFFFKDTFVRFATRLRFTTTDEGAVMTLEVRGRFGPAESATKTGKPLPQTRQA
jgi:CubicO group peptidase (beta-lactamase class C family)